MPNCSIFNGARISDVLRKALNLKEVQLLGVKLEVLAIDSTGLREDNASFYYAKRSGKNKEKLRKLTIVVDTEISGYSIS